MKTEPRQMERSILHPGLCLGQ